MARFTPRSVRLSGRIALDGPVDRVFELFSPVGEKLWVPGWDPELLHPAGVEWEAGLIFRTRDDQGEAIWIVTRLDRRAHDVEYRRVEPGRYVARVAVRCAARGPALTEASIEYEFVGLSESGNAETAATASERHMNAWRLPWQSLAGVAGAPMEPARRRRVLLRPVPNAGGRGCRSTRSSPRK